MNRKLFAALFIVSAYLLALVLPNVASAAGGTMTYFRFDRYRQSNGNYTIYGHYCLSGSWHDLYWGERSPRPYDMQQRYGQQNGCVSRLLFYDVLVNDDLYTNLRVNQTVGDVDAEANFAIKRTTSGWSCSLFSDYLNGMRPVRGNPCAWTTDSRLW